MKLELLATAVFATMAASATSHAAPAPRGLHTSPNSGIETVAYRRCYWRGGHRYCRYRGYGYGYGPGYYGGPGIYLGFGGYRGYRHGHWGGRHFRGGGPGHFHGGGGGRR